MNTLPPIGQRIERYMVVASTNDLVRAAAERGEPEGLVVTAEEQAAGRGRFGRKWIVPRGTSLQLSILLRPSLAPIAGARVVRMAAVAAAHVLEQHLHLTPVLKWPNDVLLGGRKCAGILLESSLSGDRVDYIILGIGLNVNYTMRIYPELAPRATTLQDVVGHEVDCAALERALLVELNALYARLVQGDVLMDEYRARLKLLGQTIRVATATEILQGIARDVSDDGALILELDNRSVKLYAGDVTILQENALDVS
ncbi:MAG: biotin--[acetyl-CoA-carboxylase] ligase [Chloroflexi bacterium]|nr:biotin--[acetyl-CoA-carboxylase] ligase [Chloroflexota bacterium]